MRNIMLIASDNSYTSGAFLCMVKFCEILKPNYNVYVILPNEGDGAPLLDEAGIAYEIIESRNWVCSENDSIYQKIKMLSRFIKHNVAAVNRIRHLIREKKTDIVHINTIWTYVGAVAALKENVKLVWHIREQLQQQQLDILGGNLGYKLINRADKILAVSDYISKSYKELTPSNIETVYDGLDEEVYYCNRDILQNENIRLLNIGVLDEQKGQEKIIRACALLAEKGIHNFSVQFVGDGDSYVDSLKEIVNRLGLSEMVHFCGRTRDPVSYYRNSDIYIMSSHSEAFGRTTVEAMMSGCVVIGARSGATPELLHYGKYGYLYEYADCEELCNAIIAVMKHKSDAQRKAKDAQIYAVHKFSAYNNLTTIEKIYNKLLR